MKIVLIIIISIIVVASVSATVYNRISKSQSAANIKKPVNCELDEPTILGELCSNKDDFGYYTKTTRTIKTQPENGGTECPDILSPERNGKLYCEPINCKQSDFVQSTPCVDTATGWYSTYTREITTQPQYDGRACGPEKESRFCPPIDCQLGDTFKNDGPECSYSDIRGYYTKLIRDIKVEPQFGGRVCPPENDVRRLEKDYNSCGNKSKYIVKVNIISPDSATNTEPPSRTDEIYYDVLYDMNIYEFVNRYIPLKALAGQAKLKIYNLSINSQQIKLVNGEIEDRNAKVFSLIDYKNDNINLTIGFTFDCSELSKDNIILDPCKSEDYICIRSGWSKAPNKKCHAPSSLSSVTGVNPLLNCSTDPTKPIATCTVSRGIATITYSSCPNPPISCANGTDDQFKQLWGPKCTSTGWVCATGMACPPPDKIRNICGNYQKGLCPTNPDGTFNGNIIVCSSCTGDEPNCNVNNDTLKAQMCGPLCIEGIENKCKQGVRIPEPAFLANYCDQNSDTPYPKLPPSIPVGPDTPMCGDFSNQVYYIVNKDNKYLGVNRGTQEQPTTPRLEISSKRDSSSSWLFDPTNNPNSYWLVNKDKNNLNAYHFFNHTTSIGITPFWLEEGAIQRFEANQTGYTIKSPSNVYLRFDGNTITNSTSIDPYTIFNFIPVSNNFNVICTNCDHLPKPISGQRYYDEKCDLSKNLVGTCEGHGWKCTNEGWKCLPGVRTPRPDILLNNSCCGGSNSNLTGVIQDDKKCVQCVCKNGTSCSQPACGKSSNFTPNEQVCCTPEAPCRKDSFGNSLCCKTEEQVCSASSGNPMCCPDGQVCIKNNQGIATGKCGTVCGAGDNICEEGKICVEVDNLTQRQVDELRVTAGSDAKLKIVPKPNTNPQLFTAFFCKNKEECQSSNEQSIPAALNNYYPCRSFPTSGSEIGYCAQKDGSITSPYRIGQNQIDVPKLPERDTVWDTYQGTFIEADCKKENGAISKLVLSPNSGPHNTTYGLNYTCINIPTKDTTEEIKTTTPEDSLDLALIKMNLDCGNKILTSVKNMYDSNTNKYYLKYTCAEPTLETGDTMTKKDDHTDLQQHWSFVYWDNNTWNCAEKRGAISKITGQYNPSNPYIPRRENNTDGPNSYTRQTFTCQIPSEKVCGVTYNNQTTCNSDPKCAWRNVLSYVTGKAKEDGTIGLPNKNLDDRIININKDLDNIQANKGNYCNPNTDRTQSFSRIISYEISKDKCSWENCFTQMAKPGVTSIDYNNGVCAAIQDCNVDQTINPLNSFSRPLNNTRSSNTPINKPLTNVDNSQFPQCIVSGSQAPCPNGISSSSQYTCKDSGKIEAKNYDCKLTVNGYTGVENNFGTGEYESKPSLDNCENQSVPSTFFKNYVNNQVFYRIDTEAQPYSINGITRVNAEKLFYYICKIAEKYDMVTVSNYLSKKLIMPDSIFGISGKPLKLFDCMIWYTNNISDTDGKAIFFKNGSIYLQNQEELELSKNWKNIVLYSTNKFLQSIGYKCELLSSGYSCIQNESSKPTKAECNNSCGTNFLEGLLKYNNITYFKSLPTAKTYSKNNISLSEAQLHFTDLFNLQIKNDSTVTYLDVNNILPDSSTGSLDKFDIMLFEIISRATDENKSIGKATFIKIDTDYKFVVPAPSNIRLITTYKLKCEKTPYGYQSVLVSPNTSDSKSEYSGDFGSNKQCSSLLEGISIKKKENSSYDLSSILPNSKIYEVRGKTSDELEKMLKDLVAVDDQSVYLSQSMFTSVGTGNVSSRINSMIFQNSNPTLAYFVSLYDNIKVTYQPNTTLYSSHTITDPAWIEYKYGNIIGGDDGVVREIILSSSTTYDKALSEIYSKSTQGDIAIVTERDLVNNKVKYWYKNTSLLSTPQYFYCERNNIQAENRSLWIRIDQIWNTNIPNFIPRFIEFKPLNQGIFVNDIPLVYFKNSFTVAGYDSQLTFSKGINIENRLDFFNKDFYDNVSYGNNIVKNFYYNNGRLCVNEYEQYNNQSVPLCLEYGSNSGGVIIVNMQPYKQNEIKQIWGITNGNKLFNLGVSGTNNTCFGINSWQQFILSTPASAFTIRVDNISPKPQCVGTFSNPSCEYDGYLYSKFTPTLPQSTGSMNCPIDIKSLCNNDQRIYIKKKGTNEYLTTSGNISQDTERIFRFVNLSTPPTSYEYQWRIGLASSFTNSTNLNGFVLINMNNSGAVYWESVVNAWRWFSYGPEYFNNNGFILDLKWNETSAAYNISLMSDQSKIFPSPNITNSNNLEFVLVNTTNPRIKQFIPEATKWNDWGDGLNIYLDRHNINCGDGPFKKALNSFKLDWRPNGANNNNREPGRISYSYVCGDNGTLTDNIINKETTKNGWGLGGFPAISYLDVDCRPEKGYISQFEAQTIYNPNDTNINSGNFAEIKYNYKCITSDNNKQLKNNRYHTEWISDGTNTFMFGTPNNRQTPNLQNHQVRCPKPEENLSYFTNIRGEFSNGPKDTSAYVYECSEDASNPPYTFPADPFNIKLSEKNNLCLDANGNNPDSTSNFMTKKTCNDFDPNQRFTYEASTNQIKSFDYSTLCIDDSGSTSSGTQKMILRKCDPSSNSQKFEYDSKTKLLRSKNKNWLCVDDGGNNENSWLINCIPTNANQKFDIMSSNLPSKVSMINSSNETSNGYNIFENLDLVGPDDERDVASSQLTTYLQSTGNFNAISLNTATGRFIVKQPVNITSKADMIRSTQIVYKAGNRLYINFTKRPKGLTNSMWLKIENGQYNKCINNPDGGNSQDTPIRVEDCSNSGTQNLWFDAGTNVIQLGNANTQQVGRCLDVYGNNNVNRYWVNNNNNQRWDYYTSDFSLKSRANSLCLDVKAGGELYVDNCDSSKDSQKWYPKY